MCFIFSKSGRAQCKLGKALRKCVDTELSSQDKFITNQWFDSLSLDDKKSVALYVYQSNFYACHGQRTEVFQSKLLDLDAEKQYQYYRGIGVFDLPDKSLIAHVDGIKVKQLVEIQPKSLNLRNLGHQLGFHSKTSGKSGWGEFLGCVLNYSLLAYTPSLLILAGHMLLETSNDI